MDATDREYPPAPDTAATVPQEQRREAAETADDERAPYSTAPTMAEGDDPMHESGYGFGV
jgi:hypothetical protein